MSYGNLVELGWMSDKQVFAAMVGGLVSAVLGGLLIVPVMLLAHADGGDDGWGAMWCVLMIVSGVVGFAFTAKWAHQHVFLTFPRSRLHSGRGR